MKLLSSTALEARHPGEQVAEPQAVSSETLGIGFGLETVLGVGEDIIFRIRIQDEEGTFLSFAEVAAAVPTFTSPSLVVLVLVMFALGTLSMKTRLIGC